MSFPLSPRPDWVRTIFDVGANDGKDCYDHSLYPGNRVFAFEPTPFLLHTYLFPRASETYTVIPCAVSDFDGSAELNVAGWGDWGCSSLNKFSKNLNKTWIPNLEYNITSIIKVPVITMKTFISNHKIEDVDFLHCDTQGNDLKVLKSFGPYIKKVNAGVVEGFKQNPLYQNTDNSIDNISKFLEENHFKIDSVNPVDVYQNEFNINFSRA